MRIGSLFSGYGGLDMGVQAVIGGRVAWHVEFDPAPSKILEHRFPGVPNHGDITTVDWATVEPVDVLTGGFPCQDVSPAGFRRGLQDGTRSGLWSEFAIAIDRLRPQLVVIENVRGLLSAPAHRNLGPVEKSLAQSKRGYHAPLRAAGAVLGDLADIGYDARWISIRATDAGAPHNRSRVFILAHPGSDGLQRIRSTHDDDRGDASGHQSDGLALSAADTAGGRRDRGTQGEIRDSVLGVAIAWSRRGADSLADARGRDERRGVPGLMGGTQGSGEGHQSERERNGHPLADSAASTRAWGAYGPAVRRWESILERVAPSPTEPSGKGGSQRLSPVFVEWMMGLPEGWLTAPEVGLTRNQQLKALGNGVVPQQAALAVATLLNTEAVSA